MTLLRSVQIETKALLKLTYQNSTIKNMKGKKLTFIFFGYLLEACIEIWQFFLIIFLVFHELSSQHVLENLNSKTIIVPWQLWHKLYIH
jgi:hypothetical protein